MRTFQSPKWLFLVTTAPLALLLALGYGEFNVLKTLLPPASVALWQQFGAALGGLAVGTAGYAVWLRRGGRELGLAYCLLTLALYCGVLWWYMSQADVFVPRSVPGWLVPTDLALYVWTLLMPTLAHALFALVVRLTPADRPGSLLLNFSLALGIPVGWGILSQLLAAVLRHVWPALGGALSGLSLVLSTLTFLFFVVRAGYLLGLRKAGVWGRRALVWKVLVTAVLPVAGLALNRKLAGDWSAGAGVFGNFSSPWFYGLALLNAALLCVPEGRLSKWPRLGLFLGRSALFGYTFYFFLVFLPWLPLALPAVVLIGAGFLLLAPLLLFGVHVRELSADFAWLGQFFGRRLLTAGLLAGLAVLPLSITAQYGHDRRVLHAALAYLYAPDYARRYDLDAPSLARTLATLREHKSRADGFEFGSQQPFLSTYFTWLVLDNLMLSDAKLADIEYVFLGAKTAPAPALAAARGVGVSLRTRPLPEGAAPQLTGATARSTYDPRQQAWVSWVDLRIANRDPARRAAEYRTTLTLPAGCYVSDYYLDLNGRREPGLLAEKKAAAWVYAQILHETDARDPGLLTYLGPDQLSLRVYPVVGAAARQTGLQLLHKEPVVLTIDGQRLTLGDPAVAAPLPTPVATADGAVVYLSAPAKKALPLVRRRPRLHFLLDASAAAAAGPADYQARITRHFPAARGVGQGAAPAARFSLVNAYATPVPAGADWPAQLAAAPKAGGYYLAGAMRRALFEAQLHPDPATYPVLVAVPAGRLTAAALPDDFAEFAGAYPESDLFYVLGADGRLEAHSLRRHSAQALPAELAPAVEQALVGPASSVPESGPTPARPAAPAVRAWPSAAHARAYLPDTDEAAIVLNQPAVAPLAPAAPGKTWLTGLLLHGYGQWQTLHPAAADASRVPFIQTSFRTGILTPLTAYLALENEAQKAALRRKQDQVLKANAALDTQEQEAPAGPTGVPVDGGAGLLLLAGVGLACWRLRKGTLVA